MTSFLDQLRNEYETVQRSRHDEVDVEGFDVIDARMSKSFRWLEKAVSYLNDIKSPINHRFNLGHGLRFESPRFGRGFVGQHKCNIRGFSAIDEISLHYEIAAAAPLTAEMSAMEAEQLKTTLEAANLRCTSRRMVDADGVVRKCQVTIPPAIPAAVMFRVDYRTGVVTVTLVNADRFDRLSLAFRSNAIRESVLEDVVKFILGSDLALLKRAPLAGIRGASRG
jgi:hypothetical protein